MILIVRHLPKGRGTSLSAEVPAGDGRTARLVVLHRGEVTVGLLTDGVDGTRQLAGSREFNAVFELEQPFVDALWSLIYGPRDPGPPAAPAKP